MTRRMEYVVAYDAPAEKVYQDFALEATDPGGHSSLPKPNNAIVRLSAALAKLLYLLGASIRAQAHHALHQADWIAGRLANRFGTSDENNALKLGYDPVTRTWPAWLDGLQVPRALLPEVLIPGATIGPIDPAVAATLGLPETALICAGTTDGVASFIATRAAGPGSPAPGVRGAASRYRRAGQGGRPGGPARRPAPAR